MFPKKTLLSFRHQPHVATKQMITAVALSLLLAALFVPALHLQQVKANPISVGPLVPPTTEWSQTYGGSGGDIILAMAKTSDGGYILAGYTVTYSGNGEPDFWLVKVDSSGTMQWSQHYGGTGQDYATNVVQTSDGGYAVVGYTDSEEFASPTDSSIYSWLFIRTDSSGNKIWNLTFYEPNADDRPCAIIQTHPDGGFAIAGRSALGGDKFWLLKLDSSGNTQWSQKYWGGPGTSAEPSSLIQTSDGGYAVAGYYNPGNDNTDFWLVKTDSSGTPTWNQTYGGQYTDIAKCVVQTSDGGYALAGDTYLFSGSNGPYNEPRFLLVKTDSSGVQQWSHMYTDSSWNSVVSMLQTKEGGYSILGTTGYFNPSHFWQVKTDSTGTMQWNQTYGGSGDDKPATVVQLSDGSYALAGSTNSYGAGSYDGWLIKTEPTYEFGTIQAAINNASPGDVVHVSPGIYPENVVVNKPVTLLGDDQTSIIDGGGAGNTVTVTSNDVVIKGFTIRNGGSGLQDSGIFLDDVANVHVLCNSVSGNNGFGIYVSGGQNNVISNNDVSDNGWSSDAAGIGVDGETSPAVVGNNTLSMNYVGVLLSDARNIQVGNNTITYSLNGIETLDGSRNVAVSNNTISWTTDGILFDYAFDSQVSDNRVTYNHVGILLQDESAGIELSNNQIIHNSDAGISLAGGATSNIVHDNLVESTGGSSGEAGPLVEGIGGAGSGGVGVKIDSSSGNTFYHNSFVNNQVQVSVTGASNTWDNGYPSGGNYWSDYTGVDAYSGPNQNVPGSDGIGDTPYTIDASNIDHYPLFQTTAPTATSTTTTIGGNAFIDQTGTTGVCVSISDPTIPDGTSITVTSIAYGTSQPPETGTLSIGGVYYDVKITSDPPLNPDTTIIVTITNPSFSSTSQIQYWNGVNWVTVPTQFIPPDTLQGTFQLYQLQGTPIVVIPLPEYAYGSLLALVPCLAVYTAFRKAKTRKTK